MAIFFYIILKIVKIFSLNSFLNNKNNLYRYFVIFYIKFISHYQSR